MDREHILIDKIKAYIKKHLEHSRYIHSIEVARTASKIGLAHNLDINMLAIAALLHDCAKHLSLEQLKEYCIKHNQMPSSLEASSHAFLHAQVSAIIATNIFNIKEHNIINAIKSHTLGRVNMSIYEEVIFVADFCEPTRNIVQAKNIIILALSNIKKAVFAVISNKLEFLIKKGLFIHPQSIDVYNKYHIY